MLDMFGMNLILNYGWVGLKVSFVIVGGAWWVPGYLNQDVWWYLVVFFTVH